MDIPLISTLHFRIQKTGLGPASRLPDLISGRPAGYRPCLCGRPTGYRPCLCGRPAGYRPSLFGGWVGISGSAKHGNIEQSDLGATTPGPLRVWSKESRDANDSDRAIRVVGGDVGPCPCTTSEETHVRRNLIAGRRQPSACGLTFSVDYHKWRDHKARRRQPMQGERSEPCFCFCSTLSHDLHC